MRAMLAAMAILAVAGGCVTPGAGPSGEEGDILVGAGPPDADPDRCYSRFVRPTTYETVTVQKVVRAERTDLAGRVTSPAVFREVVETRKVSDREVVWFETPCAARGDGDFIRSVQRALGVRGLYQGPVTGTYDELTVAAVRAFQRPLGIESGVISVEAAERLGLLELGRERA